MTRNGKVVLFLKVNRFTASKYKRLASLVALTDIKTSAMLSLP